MFVVSESDSSEADSGMTELRSDDCCWQLILLHFRNFPLIFVIFFFLLLKVVFCGAGGSPPQPGPAPGFSLVKVLAEQRHVGLETLKT